MTSNSIFPVLSLDRSVVRWEEHLETLTPWEEHQGIWFKREDHFAPLSYGGPNGSKMRQLVWYFNRYRGNKTTVVTGASVQSPQLSMSAIVAAHYGLDCLEVVYSKPHTLMGHPNPRIAAGFGATFDYARGPYNPILQSRVKELETPDSMTVEYGITLPIDRYSPEEVRAFHTVGARQTQNIPDQVERLIVPAGSCNTLCSVLLGLLEDCHNVKELYTIAIGPNKWDWVVSRMRHMGLELGDLPFKWRHHSLHDTGYAAYGDKFKGESWDGIEFHETYEAKMIRWMREHKPMAQDDSTGFWIVGSAAQEAVVRPFYTHAALGRHQKYSGHRGVIK